MIITGMGELTLGELAGERMTVAYEERSQEDEHSCFSDNTTNDYIANIVGVEAVANGTFGDVSGVGIVDAIAASDQEAADALTESIAASKAAAQTIEAPLDQYLVVGVPDSDPGRMAILSTIEALEAQAIAITAGATALGITIG
jgi:putative iron-regulated protein